MELTGKCKEGFKEWWINFMDQEMSIHTFIQQHKSMQYGIYVDFFDSVGVIIEITPYFDSVTEVMLWFFTLENKKCMHLNSHLENKAKTRPEARLLAIQKANEIYNDAH